MNEEKECPACNLMNNEAADTCRHCGTAFFFELECLDPKFDDPADELIVVGRCADVINANLLKDMLESNDIDACIPEELAPPIGQIEIMTVRVARRNFDAARQIIAQSRNS